MKVFLTPTGLQSRAMFRVAAALKQTLPVGWEAVESLDEAELVVLHVIGQDAIEYAERLGKPYAVIQYCMKSAGGTPTQWQEFWAKAKAVWSYYDLSASVQEVE